MRYYPVFLDLAGQHCVVLGDGKFATEKAASLREAGANVQVIPSREYRTGDLAGARLVVDASEDTEVNRRSWQEAEEAGILINVVDRPAQCRFIAPAIVRRDPLLVAISTSGESPYLASALRARIERWLGREWGPFTALVGSVRRQLRERSVPIPEQTRAYRRIINSDVRRLLKGGRHDEAAHMAVAIAQAGDSGTGRVALVGAGPGDPDLLTFKARELLADADYVLHDALIAPETLALCGPDARLEDVGKRAGLDNPRQEEITARLIELARAGNAVVRLKGGDPFVFGRGGEELAGLTRAGIDVVVVPGVTAALAAPAAAGIPVTLRGVASSVAITTAQGGGSLDRLRALALAADTLVVLMPRAGLKEVAALLARVVGGLRPAAVISNATLPNQRSISGPIDRIAILAEQAAIETPATLVVGDVVAAAPALAVVPNSIVDGGFG
ncbi:MAG: uroporphyrinogen-III C-methyltransferase [Actinobacteria bacterium 13_1_20CM_2_65_11]|nr:MAG: uroporphyrinogen-III C-methyltransferase [Chloroflexi bacterium 13_1_40CM_65_17]OLC68986.1 MAG: uroporphyrinogen-III C-methyltransferase [Actinobacteria bacterium 13_1_40CM_4_65_12]OLD25019.1 MAG: uroporphyrinogen-III C-methyltransferase [Chloroflexi bacterium 13_1_40CM_3_65_12]OLD48887.1 MAG: uroporphyrinogen-III C-methyltransferase [Actinobacteria bacterium 13_1_40CM_2_65_8]OLE80819.1 MAG: uroporphyrinogen-III C-methyltransferase [Actinobacteria bacterium 13_1_20CM_2_65_11]